MRYVLLTAFAALTACTSSTSSPTDSGGDSVAADSAAVDTPVADTPDGGGFDSGLYAQLHGTRPNAALPAPDFVAINSDETLRDKEALLGHPTVMWFFPFSGTPG
jgi:hypothetical protein